MRRLIPASLVVLALAAGACSQPSEAPDAAGEAKSNAPRAAGDMPAPRPGVWEMTISGGPTTRICVGPPEAGQNPFARPGGDCSRQDIRRVGTGAVFDLVCESAGMTVTSQGRVTGDLSSAYTVDVKTAMTRAGQAPFEMEMQTSARYLGPCPAGTRPGQAVP